MSNFKLMLKDRVLSAGSGYRRVILCYESGLVYQYKDPENILAVFEKGKGWIILEAPRYHQGGWGNPSTGDADGHYLISNAEQLIRAIGGRRLRLNSQTFLMPEEMNRLNREIETNNRLIAKQNEIAKKLNRKENIKDLVPQESFQLTPIASYESVISIKGLDAIKTAAGYDTAIKVFLESKGKPIKIDNYQITRDTVHQGSTVVAFRDAAGDVFMNSQVLNTTSFERVFMGNQSLIQAEIRKIAKYSIPFNVLAAANLKLSETKVVEQGPESTHRVKLYQYDTRTEERHFTGALLLENNGRKFLMDIDRIEIKHQLFNAFFVEVNASVPSIAEAYESMKPQRIKDAERYGTEVRRQGEWFFVATDKTIRVKSNEVYRWMPMGTEARGAHVLYRAVSHGKGRPNNLYQPVGFGELDKYVCGTVSHQGREHADLDLGIEVETVMESDKSDGIEFKTFKLWELVPNATVSNFTITGDVD